MLTHFLTVAFVPFANFTVSDLLSKLDIYISILMSIYDNNFFIKQTRLRDKLHSSSSKIHIFKLISKRYLMLSDLHICTDFTVCNIVVYS